MKAQVLQRPGLPFNGNISAVFIHDSGCAVLPDILPVPEKVQNLLPAVVCIAAGSFQTAFQNREIFTVHLIKMGTQLGAERGQVTQIILLNAQAYLRKKIYGYGHNQDSCQRCAKDEGFSLLVHRTPNDF